jgi:hypothetical protein
MVPLSLFATARRHWTWLRSASERLCQFTLGSKISATTSNLSFRRVYQVTSQSWVYGGEEMGKTIV